MPIRFTCEVTDPHTEDLLRYLEHKYGADTILKRMVLDQANKWLEIESPGGIFRGDPDTKQLLLVDVQSEVLSTHPEPL
jgi:hypothetical protein